jgi:iron complex transport system permease protein
VSFLRPKLYIAIAIGLALFACFLGLLTLGDVPLGLKAYQQALVDPQSLYGQIIWSIRLPRNLTALGVGCMLGMAGAIAQGYFRNPLADPGIIGISGGAGLGAALAITLGLGLVAGAVEVMAFGVSIIMSLIILAFVSRFSNRQALILLGVGLSSLTGALMALVFNLSPSPITTAEILAWMMGSVENRNWQDVWICLIGIGLAGLVILGLGKGMRLLTLGEDTAQSQGVDLKRLSQKVVLALSLLAGLAVSVAGLIGFVGLAAPHLVRSLGLKDPYRLIWPSGLAGGIMVLSADALVRLLPASTDIRLGVLTALIGAPIFSILALKSAKAWAGDNQ